MRYTLDGVKVRKCSSFAARGTLLLLQSPIRNVEYGTFWQAEF
jgi:hypothetical protein